jgi:shikimate kinase
MDAEIEARAGKSIPRVFAEDGEETFRRMEAVLCQELSAQDGLVIASGGGTLVDPANRASLLRSGTVVCLTCDVDEILRRLREGPRSGRPLLNVADPRAEVERLLEARRPAYAAIPWQVDTTRLSVEQVAARVVEIVNGETRETRFFGKRSDKTWFLAVQFLAVHHPGGEYSIIIGDGLLAHVGDLLGTAGVPEVGGVAAVCLYGPGWRGAQDTRHGGAIVRAVSGRGAGPGGDGVGPGRRRDWRRGGVCGGDLYAGRAPGAGAHHAPGDGR